jgi:hypothetical protein
MTTPPTDTEPFIRPASYSYLARYGLLRTVTKVAPFTYIVHGKSAYMRGAEGMVDFEGGPYIVVGMRATLALDAPPWVGKTETVSSVEQIGAAEGRELCGLVPVAEDRDAWVRVRTRAR